MGPAGPLEDGERPRSGQSASLVRRRNCRPKYNGMLSSRWAMAGKFGTRWAQHEPLVLEIWAFGSRVRGQTKVGGPVRPDSDFDIAIRLDLPPSDDLWDVQSISSEFRK